VHDNRTLFDNRGSVQQVVTTVDVKISWDPISQGNNNLERLSEGSQERKCDDLLKLYRMNIVTKC
jgi:hypothetical protein